MITLPDGIHPSSATARLLDLGFVQEYAGGGSARIDRPGNRFEIELSFPLAYGDDARVLVARLTRAKSAGLRVEYPLQGVSQGSPGAPVVDGTDSAGRTLKLRGLTVGYVAKEGYWLTLIDGAGKYYLHLVTALASAGNDGKATLAVEPPLRVFPGDGAVVLLAKPMVEGFVSSVVEWGMAPGSLTGGLGVTLREAA